MSRFRETRTKRPARRLELTGPLLVISADVRYADTTIAGLRASRIPCVSLDRCAIPVKLGVQGLGAIAIDLARAEDWHACVELTAHALAHRVPVVAVSDWVAPDGRYRRRAFTLGCAAFVRKTISAEPLIGALRRVSAGEREVEVVVLNTQSS